VSEAEEEALEEESGSLPLAPPSLAAGTVVTAEKLAISSQAGEAIVIALDGGAAAERLALALADAQLPKAVHDAKLALRALGPRGITLAGVIDDPMLYSYLLDPTYSSSLESLAL